jgi:hypothetical protein
MAVASVNESVAVRRRIGRSMRDLDPSAWLATKGMAPGWGAHPQIAAVSNAPISPRLNEIGTLGLSPE